VGAEMTLYSRGFTEGKDLAEKVLDLEYNTENKRVSSGYIPDVVPLDENGRRAWLRGFANGITSVTDGWPEKGSALYPEEKVTGFGDLDFEHGAKLPRFGSDENP